MLCLTSPASKDSPAAGIASHVPDTGGCSRSVATGLLQQRAGRLACLPSTPIAVCRAYWMHQHGWSSIYVATTTSQKRLSIYTGCAFQYKIALLTYTVFQGTAPRYLGPLVLVSDLPGQRAFRSASTIHLVVSPFKLSLIGSRTLKFAAAQTWNGLLEDVPSPVASSIFCNRLKTHLFCRSYPHIVSWSEFSIVFLTVALN